MSARKPNLSVKQQIDLSEILQKIDGSKFAKMTNKEQKMLYDFFVSLPYADRGKTRLLSKRLRLALAVLQAVDRIETKITIKNSPTLCKLKKDLQFRVLMLGGV